MIRLINLFAFLTFSNVCISQSKGINEIAVSPTLIWNTTTIFNSYSGARAANKTGNAFSKGINLSYSKTIYKKIFGSIGIGLFNQKFGIQRPFDFQELVIGTNLLYSTKYYQYKNYDYFFGIGFSQNIVKKMNLKVSLNYHLFNTYQQDFVHTGFINPVFGNPQIKKNNYLFGNSLVSKIGITKVVYKNWGVGLDLLLPVYNRWRKDEIFREDDNEFYGSKFSIGSAFNLIYKINKK